MTNPWAAFEVFVATSKVGLVGFGGGNAMISLLEREVVDVRGWMTSEKFAEITGISFAVPGLSAAKLAAFVGWEQAGLIGMLAGLIGIWLPGMALMLALFYLLRTFNETWWYPRLLRGFLFAAAGLVIATIFVVMPSLPLRGAATAEWLRYAAGAAIAAAVCFTVVYLKQVPPALVVVAGGLLGLLVF